MSNLSGQKFYYGDRVVVSDTKSRHSCKIGRVNLVQEGIQLCSYIYLIVTDDGEKFTAKQEELCHYVETNTEPVPMVDQKSWQRFRDSGLLWFINQILHAFGWAICVSVDENGKAISAYPARVRFRGFSDKDQTEGYQRLSRFMKENADSLLDESME